MRKKLKSIEGQRLRFVAKVERFGEMSAYRGMPIPTILLTNVRLCETGVQVTDHIWFKKGKSWEHCTKGCEVAFDARVSTYEKGYKGYRNDCYDAPVTMDYRLERPTKVVIIQS